MTDHTTMAAALAAVQAALPTVHKGRTATIPSKQGPGYSYRYADLSDVTAAIMPLLSRNGLAFTCHPRLAGGGYELAATLMHTSGESVEGALPLTGGTPQQLGSSITYMRRYLLGSLTGLVTDDDDDARAATEAAKEARREVHKAAAEDAVPRISDKQTKHMHALLGELGIKDRQKYIALASWSTGRELSSTGDMTTQEAAHFIDYLATRAADLKPQEESA